MKKSLYNCNNQLARKRFVKKLTRNKRDWRNKGEKETGKGKTKAVAKAKSKAKARSSKAKAVEVQSGGKKKSPLKKFSTPAAKRKRSKGTPERGWTPSRAAVKTHQAAGDEKSRKILVELASALDGEWGFQVPCLDAFFKKTLSCNNILLWIYIVSM